MSRHAAPLHGIWHGEPPDLGEPSAGLESRRRRALRRARARGRRGRATSRFVALAVLLVGAGCRTVTGSGGPPGVPCEQRLPGECSGHWTASCDCEFTFEECSRACGALTPHWIPPGGCICT